MKILAYIIATILYGAMQLLVGFGIIAIIYAFFAVLIVPPMAFFQSFVDANIVAGSIWLIVSLFIYGAAFKMSNHG